ncbi:Bifunctional arginine demethylase and lysyl-hydroxylase JMJD6 [Amphibalanus amphitrite]|uniref:Bifunctional arginine demethylase and lysyl-hydroxylase JMJD6 n=1 Tax=Amphibalanus amphitrite TaxID=1232801 RepID=A0A6A4XEV2_AMPAM|nr:Bifunctional arginine demethylase and lysyl-hydroxylase JMJD6 [Amphibalanus amphitrite]
MGECHRMRHLPHNCFAMRKTCLQLLQGCSQQQLLFWRNYLTADSQQQKSQQPELPQTVLSFLLLLSITTVLILFTWPCLRQSLGTNPCLVPNNFALMETTRPISSCDICSAELPVRLHRPDRAEFAAHAYRGRPVLVSGATETWPAQRRVNLPFLRRLYARVGANASSVSEDGCQFLAFRSALESLEEVLEGRVEAAADGPPWYIGWSNCDPRVAAMLRGLYSWPSFLPEEGEGSAVDWIFMGTPGQGTAVHIDNVHRPSWQAQIAGSKRWRLFPPPECEKVCRPLTVDVHPGDIFLLDTNQWYHGTEVIGKEMSITIGSEYD